MWSSLPADILHIVKDKLDVFDIASVNSVCRNWWFASRTYPQRQTVGNGIPWIMQPGFHNTFQVTSVTRDKTIIIDLSKFGEGNLHFSKQGWLLISFSRDTRHCRWILGQLILLNPLTKAIIELPEYEFDPSGRDPKYIGSASFSIDKGHPHTVVLNMRNLSCPLKLSVAKVGDAAWTDYCYNSWQLELGLLPLIGFLIIEPCIYCCYSYGEIVIYNIDTRVWKEVRGHGEEMKSLFQDDGNELLLPNPSKNFYVDCDGKLVLYGNVNGNDRYFCYDDSGDTWTRLSDDFKIKKSIFNNFPMSFVRTMGQFLEVYPDVHASAYLAENGETIAWVDIG